MPGKRYLPSASVTVVRAPICDGDVAVTVTPGSTAPWASLTVPVRRPWPICANAADGTSIATAAATASRNTALDLIHTLLEAGNFSRYPREPRGRQGV